ncbi:hypothetical protein JCM10512_3544 [Bacteroides reticulotermitis JCM 10512]|uniref:Uncharacterized protein n=1 Tax=Bacteroides reticulotermitis JCM 10512 TaxID=1445607 RepID=W4UV83_9BACE|nr:hypothetical protein JCM10512_3544 [Bacteroides reticulotermitis JCM 10512]
MPRSAGSESCRFIGLSVKLTYFKKRSVNVILFIFLQFVNLEWRKGSKRAVNCQAIHGSFFIIYNPFYRSDQ